MKELEVLYHATRPPLLPEIIEYGLRDDTGHSRFGGQTGVSMTDELDVVRDGSFGNLVLEFDAKRLRRGFHLYPVRHRAVAADEHEIRVEKKRETFGPTVIPFALVTGIIRIAPSLASYEIKELQRLAPGIPVAQVWKGELVRLV